MTFLAVAYLGHLNQVRHLKTRLSAEEISYAFVVLAHYVGANLQSHGGEMPQKLTSHHRVKIRGFRLSLAELIDTCTKHYP